MQVLNDKEEPFGGTILLLSVDFRKTGLSLLPLVNEIIECLKNRSYGEVVRALNFAELFSNMYLTITAKMKKIEQLQVC